MTNLNRATYQFLFAAAAIAVLCLTQMAFAGAPLKGIDVKLGKNPGGGCAARTTTADGKADFGVWPKGSYTLSFTPQTAKESSSGMANGRMQAPAVKPVSSKLHIVITGASTGKVERDIVASQSSERAAPLQFSLDGTQSLVVLVTAD